MSLELKSWQIPRRPQATPPGSFSWFLYRLVRRLVTPVHRWYIHMETEAQIRSLKFVGVGLRVNGPIQITSPHNVVFGEDVSINPGFYGQGAGGITFGNHIHLGQNIRILTQNHNYLEPECLPYDKTRIPKPVFVGDCVWIGDNVCIVPGVSIGEGAIVAMGSVVTKDVLPLSVVGGAPASIIKMRDPDVYWRLKNEGKFLNWPIVKLPASNSPSISRV